MPACGPSEEIPDPRQMLPQDQLANNRDLGTVTSSDSVSKVRYADIMDK